MSDTIYERGPVKLYHGDCMEILPTLEAGSVDAVVTDPPYGIRHSSSYGATWQNTEIAGDDSPALRDAVLQWAGNRPWAVFGNYKTIPPTGFKAKIIWDKGPAFGMGDLKFPWKPSFEECWISKGPWRADYRGEGVWRGPCIVSWETVAGGRDHPHQKPEWLMIRLVEALPQDLVILDPFTGSGTTAIACIRTGRRFVGMEIERKYFDIACARIDRELNQGKLAFGKTAPVKETQRTLIGGDA